MNISFLTEKLPYSQICGTKLGTCYKNGVYGLIQENDLTELNYFALAINLVDQMVGLVLEPVGTHGSIGRIGRRVLELRYG